MLTSFLFCQWWFLPSTHHSFFLHNIFLLPSTFLLPLTFSFVYLSLPSFFHYFFKISPSSFLLSTYLQGRRLLIGFDRVHELTARVLPRQRVAVCVKDFLVRTAELKLHRLTISDINIKVHLFDIPVTSRSCKNQKNTSPETSIFGSSSTPKE